MNIYSSRPAQRTAIAVPAQVQPGALYNGRKNTQSASLSYRLRHHGISVRKILLYAVAGLLLAAANPLEWTFATGSIFVVLGLALRIWTFGHLEKNQTMITTGPFAHTRNPAYLGSALITFGIVLAAGNNHNDIGIAVWGFGLAALGVFFNIYLPRKYKKEYGRLKRLFPCDFDRHAANVPDLIPRITAWDSGDSRRFSWQLVRINHELAWPFVSMLALALMWL